MITRRTTPAGLALLTLSPAARAEPGHDTMTRHAADASGKRPAVILLHGSRGVVATGMLFAVALALLIAP